MGPPQLVDTTPTTVDVTPGHVVFWDGAQRAGRLRDVPAYLAMHWQKHLCASIVDEPVSAGVASHSRDDMARVQRRGHNRTPCDSDDLRDTSTDLTADADADHLSAAGVGPAPPGPVPPGQLFSSYTFELYGFHNFGSASSVAA
jgi:hypothetical protein